MQSYVATTSISGLPLALRMHHSSLHAAVQCESILTLRELTFVSTTYKIQFSASQRADAVSTVRTSHSVVFKEILGAYFYNRTKHIDTLCDKM
jgi:hypothetical protein